MDCLHNTDVLHRRVGYASEQLDQPTTFYIFHELHQLPPALLQLVGRLGVLLLRPPLGLLLRLQVDGERDTVPEYAGVLQPHQELSLLGDDG